MTDFSLKKNTLLWIVEDSQEQVELLKTKLEKRNWRFEISSFDSAEKANAALKECLSSEQKKASLPNLIILDLGLPGEGGLSVLKNFHQAPGLSQLPVIVLTASGDQSDMSQSYRGGAAFFLKKPLDEELLYQVLHQLKVTNRF